MFQMVSIHKPKLGVVHYLALYPQTAGELKSDTETMSN